MKITFQLNGAIKEVVAKPGEKVRDLLEREGMVSARNSCDGQGTCGSCAVLLKGRLVNSCLLVAPQIEGKELCTVADDIPVAATTAAIPPHPNERASVAAHARRERSFNTSDNERNFSLIHCTTLASGILSYRTTRT